jgi:hypothetical protein
LFKQTIDTLWKMMTGKATARPALSLPLLGEDVDLEQACEHDDDKRLHHGNYDLDPNYYCGFLILSFLQLVKIGLTSEQVPSDKAVVGLLLGYVLFCTASVVYKLSIKNNPAVLVPKLWVHVIFASVLLEYLMRSAVLLLQLDNGKQQPTFLSDMEGALLSICTAAVLYKLSLKNHLVMLVPEVWVNLVFSTALLVNAETAYQVLMAGALFMSLLATIFSTTVLQSMGNSC